MTTPDYSATLGLDSTGPTVGLSPTRPTLAGPEPVPAPATQYDKAVLNAQLPTRREAKAMDVSTLFPAEFLPTPETEYTPDISKRVRTVAYFGIGIAAPTVGLLTGISAVWFPELTVPVAATGVTVLSFLGTVAGVFGITYRPTR